MPRKALIYAWVVIVAGFTVMGRAAVSWQLWARGPFLTLLGLAMLAATLKLRLPNLAGTLSPAFVFLLISAATLSWPATVAIAAVSGVVQCAWRPKVRPSALQLAFNGSMMAVSGSAAHGMAHGIVVSANMLPVMLGMAGTGLLVSNTLIMSTILCLLEDGPFDAIWGAVQLWAVPYYLGGGLLASVWARADLGSEVPACVLAGMSVYVLSVCFRELGSRMQGRIS